MSKGEVFLPLKINRNLEKLFPINTQGWITLFSWYAYHIDFSFLEDKGPASLTFFGLVALFDHFNRALSQKHGQMPLFLSAGCPHTRNRRAVLTQARSLWSGEGYE
jgi:hypothetical protein